MKEYISTRNKNINISASKAIIKGLADDGGLFVLPSLDHIQINIESLLHKSYQEIALAIMKPFLSDFTQEELTNCITNAYASTFDTNEITPITKLNENEYVLELSHGRTSAFKDVALSLLPYLMTSSLKINDSKDKTLILTATSGDTGKAALEGFKNVDDISIMVFYPLSGVSPIQEKQMISTDGNNVVVCGIHGNFDDAQSAVMVAFNSRELNDFASANGYQLSSANSINIGRLLPQIVYYYVSYVRLIERKEITLGEEINFSVPTGNFGDILAGYIAKCIGLPINTLLCASNSNNVLFEFLSTGIYDRNKELVKTISPSMDILISSNLERLLYYASNDTDYVASLMKSLQDTGKYEITNELLGKLQTTFYPSFATEKETKECIHHVYEKYNYVLDPHSAVGYKALVDYKRDTQDTRKCIVLNTASPFKFADDVLDALQIKKSDDSFTNLTILEEATGLAIPKNLKSLKDLDILHNNKINKDNILDFIREKMVK